MGAKEVLRGIQPTFQNEAGKDGVQGCREKRGLLFPHDVLAQLHPGPLS